jgi:hypothetical protein
MALDVNMDKQVVRLGAHTGSASLSYQHNHITPGLFNLKDIINRLVATKPKVITRTLCTDTGICMKSYSKMSRRQALLASGVG